MPPRLPSLPSTTPSFADRVVAARLRRQRRGVVLLALGALLLLAALWGHRNPTASRLVHEALDHPVALGGLAYALAAAGIVHLLDDRVRRIVVGVLLAGVGATGFGLAGLVISAGVSADHTVDVVRSPSGSLEAVVDDDGGQPLRIVRIAVQGTGAGLGSRRYDVACVAARGEGSPVRSVAWAGRDLTVTTRQGPQRIALSESGHPDAVLADGPGCR